VCVRPVFGVALILALVFQVLKVITYCGRDGVRPDMRRGVCALLEQSARLVLCLTEIKDRNTISVGVVVGNADRVDNIGLFADIPSQHPLAAERRLTLATARLAIAEV